MRNILLSGRPGVGKTTLIQSLARAVGTRACGFYTEELRENGSRAGFAVVTLAGQRDILAHVDYPEPQRVGKYGVKPQRLHPALEELRRCLREGGDRVAFIDEIGKMELLLPEFAAVVEEALDAPLPVVATVMAGNHPFCRRLHRRPDVVRVRVDRDNRDSLLAVLERELAPGR